MLLRVAYLLVAVLLLAYFGLRADWLYALLVLPFGIAAFLYFLRFTERVNREMEQFVLAAHYRDFTRHYALDKSPPELRRLRDSLNKLNAEFLAMRRQQDARQQYLMKILELIDTGILSFETTTGETMWINQAMQKILDIPYMKNIHMLKGRKDALLDYLLHIRHGDSQLLPLTQKGGEMKVLVNATVFKTEGKAYTLVALQNVSDAMDETESLAWQKLLSVMTHEIMNSVAPIASLADTLAERLQQREQTGLPEDLELGIATIQRRSAGLIKFATLYRNLNNRTRLEMSGFPAGDLLANIDQLMGPTLQQKGIVLEIVLADRGLQLHADRNLLEQVLINLLLNAMAALKNKADGRIVLAARMSGDRPLLEVYDNGKGIAPEVLDKIFVPFFSTRKGGNGIGLSFCKQMMLLHGGNIQVESQEGTYTRFRLLFKKG